MYSIGLMKTFVIHVGKRIFLYRVDDCATSVRLWAMLFLRGQLSGNAGKFRAMFIMQRLSFNWVTEFLNSSLLQHALQLNLVRDFQSAPCIR